jgi:phosphoribosylglycinamide formyltransferase-1
LEGTTTPVRIAIFASGGGSNAYKLLEYFSASKVGEISLLLSNNPESGVFELGPEFKVPVVFLPPGARKNGQYLLRLLEAHEIELIVLAGYLKHIPDALVAAFPRRILNIHPALLPRHGGKGMYGMHVHRAVIDAGDPFSGITIHYVNENYDEGEIIFQKKLSVAPFWQPEELQQAVLKLEHQHFPEVVARCCQELRKP